MPRSSRKSYKQHKYGSRDAGEYTDSEEEDILERREGQVANSGVSRDSDSGEKRKARDLLSSGEYGSSKRRKDRASLSVRPDRWNGGVRGLEGGTDKGMEKEMFVMDTELMPKVRMARDSRTKSSKLLDGGTDRREDSLVSSLESEEVKMESSKRKMENNGIRKERHQHANLNEKQRDPEKYKSVRDRMREGSVDIVGTIGGGSESSMKQYAQLGDEEHYYKKEMENSGRVVHSELWNSDLEEDCEKQDKKSGETSSSNDTHDDEDDDSRLMREHCIRNGRCKDEKHKDDGTKDKHRPHFKGDYGYKNNKHQDECQYKGRSSDRSDSKHLRHENNASESCHKKSKLQGNNFEGSFADDQCTGYNGNDGRKSPDNNLEYGSSPHRMKQQGTDMEKHLPNTSSRDSPGERTWSKSHTRRVDAVDFVRRNSREKDPPAVYACTRKEIERNESKDAVYVSGDSLSDERGLRSGTQDISERLLESHYIDRSRQKIDSHSGELSGENAICSLHDRSPKSVRKSSPSRLTERSPSSTNVDARYSIRPRVRRSLDAEETGQSRISRSKDHRDYCANGDRDQNFSSNKHAGEDFIRADQRHHDETPATSSFNRMGSFLNSSSGLPTPPPPCRHGAESASVMGSSEDETLGPIGDRKTNNHYRRNADSIAVSRGQGSHRWKGVPNWPSPATNGFIPFQRGPATSGFHPAVQQFPASLFGVRPSMEMSHAGVPWQDPHRPFGWQNPVADPLRPPFHGWDGSNGMFGEESHICGRPDWDPSRQLVTSQGWEINPDMWKGQNGVENMAFLFSNKEAGYPGRVSTDDVWGSGHCARNERNRSDRQPAESIKIRRSGNSPIPKTATEMTPVVAEKIAQSPVPSQIEDDTTFLRTYLSKIDISIDLASPELYDQSMSLIGMEDSNVNIDNHRNVLTEDDTEIMATTSKDNLEALLVPSSTDTVFEKSMALYKKQKEEMKAKLSILAVPNAKLVEEASLASDKETAGPMEILTETRIKAVDLQAADQNIQADSFVNAKEQECNGLVVSDGSRVCEASKPELVEFRVNLSRIPYSPESTH